MAINTGHRQLNGNRVLCNNRCQLNELTSSICSRLWAAVLQVATCKWARRTIFCKHFLQALLDGRPGGGQRTSGGRNALLVWVLCCALVVLLFCCHDSFRLLADWQFSLEAAKVVLQSQAQIITQETTHRCTPD